MARIRDYCNAKSSYGIQSHNALLQATCTRTFCLYGHMNLCCVRVVCEMYVGMCDVINVSMNYDEERMHVV